MEIENPQTDIKEPYKPSASRSSMPMIAGIFLLIAGILGIFFWIQFLLMDSTTLSSLIDINQFTQIDPSMTIEQVIGFINTCAIVGLILSIFPMLGGILAIKRKLWGISLTCGIIGLFTLGFLFSSSGLSLIAIIVLVISRKDF